MIVDDTKAEEDSLKHIQDMRQECGHRKQEKRSQSSLKCGRSIPVIIDNSGAILKICDKSVGTNKKGYS